MNSSFSIDSFIESTSSHSDYDYLSSKRFSTLEHFKNNLDIHINNDYQNKMFSLENLNKDLNEEFKKYFKLDDSKLDSFDDCDKHEYSFSEENNNRLESNHCFLRKKIERNDIDEKNDKEKIFHIEKKPKYRLDYYKMVFVGDFLKWVLSKIQELINNCKFCKKFGNKKFHMANRELYAGNPKEKDNREFINKTIEEVFTIPEDKKEFVKRSQRQLCNEDIINNIYDYHERLSIKKNKDENYLNQFKAIEEFIKFIKITIKDALDMYYDSKEFQKFKSTKKIQFFDKMFYNERNRQFSLLEKNNYVRLVNMPYYSNKEKRKKNKKK